MFDLKYDKFTNMVIPKSLDILNRFIIIISHIIENFKRKLKEQCLDIDIIIHPIN
jgi:hypothetical protein